MKTDRRHLTYFSLFLCLLTCATSPASAEGIIQALSDAIWGPKAIEVTIRSSPNGAVVMLGSRETRFRTDGTVFVHPASLATVAVRLGQRLLPITRCRRADLGEGRQLYSCKLA
jgi:hypothetical protein